MPPTPLVSDRAPPPTVDAPLATIVGAPVAPLLDPALMLIKPAVSGPVVAADTRNSAPLGPNVDAPELTTMEPEGALYVNPLATKILPLAPVPVLLPVATVIAEESAFTVVPVETVTSPLPTDPVADADRKCMYPVDKPDDAPDKRSMFAPDEDSVYPAEIETEPPVPPDPTATLPPTRATDPAVVRAPPV